LLAWSAAAAAVALADVPMSERPDSNPSSSTGGEAATAVRIGALGIRSRARPIAWERSRYTTIVVYLASRVLLVGIAAATSAVEHEPLLSALGHWDGALAF